MYMLFAIEKKTSSRISISISQEYQSWNNITVHLLSNKELLINQWMKYCSWKLFGMIFEGKYTI